MRNPAFCIYENKDTDQLRGNSRGSLALLARGSLELSKFKQSHMKNLDGLSQN